MFIVVGAEDIDTNCYLLCIVLCLLDENKCNKLHFVICSPCLSVHISQILWSDADVVSINSNYESNVFRVKETDNI